MKINMKKRVTFTIEIPAECTEDEAREWIYFELRYNAVMASKNPLAAHRLEAEDVIIDEV